MSSMTPVRTNLLHDPGDDPSHPAYALAAINQIERAGDAAQLLDRLVRATAALGATASVYTTLIPEPAEESSSFSLFACDPRFAHDQFTLGPWQDHPWLRFARTHAAPGTEQDLRVLTEADAKAIELARRYGFASCLIVPTPAGWRLERVGVLCLGSDDVDHFRRDATRFARLLAHSLAAELHDWVSAHVRKNLEQSANLGAKDIELLALEWQGLSSKAIAQRTRTSVAAVDSRFQRLNRRLNCANRRSSARRAAEYGLLEGHAR